MSTTCDCLARLDKARMIIEEKYSDSGFGFVIILVENKQGRLQCEAFTHGLNNEALCEAHEGIDRLREQLLSKGN